MALGVLSVGAGIIAFVWPAATFTVIAWLLLLRGVFGIVGAFEYRSAGVQLWWFSLVLAILEIAVAICAVRYPGRSVVSLVLWIGIWTISRGIALVGHRLHGAGGGQSPAVQLTSPTRQLTGAADPPAAPSRG